MAYRQLSRDDRIRISTLREEGRSPTYIARTLWKHRSTIYRELDRNKTRWWKYDPDRANQKAYVRRHTKKKPCMNIRMHRYIEWVIRQQLLDQRSPEQITMRVKAEYHFMTSGSSIRRYINSRYARPLKAYLQKKKWLKKYKKRKKKWERSKILYRVSIDLRPFFVSNPCTTGHYECDFIESIKSDKTVLLTLIDKRSRLKVAVKLKDKQAWRVKEALLDIIERYWIKTITFDNDLSFAKHYELWIPTYFCHPYHSREKWQIEKANAGWRRFFPKWTKLKNIPVDELNDATSFLNHLPMECLWWNTPRETHFRCRIRYLPIIP